MSGSTTSAYDNANKPTTALQNPLDIYGKYVGVQNALNETKMFQARQAAGQAFQNSLDPNGMPNQQQFNKNIVAAGAQAAPAALAASQAGQTLDDATFDTHMKRLTGLNAAAMGLVAQYPNGVPKQAALDELARVGPTMGLSPQQIAQAEASFGDDPQANSMTIIRNGMQNLQAQAALHAARPGTGTQTGPDGVTIGFQTGAQAGPTPGAVSVPPQAGAPQGMDAGARGAVSTITNPDGSQSTDTLEGHMAAGRITPLGAVAPGYKAAAASPGGPRDYTNAPNELLGGLPNPSEAAPTQSGPKGGGTTVPATLRQSQEASAAQYTADSRDAGTYQSRVYPLQQAASALQTAKTGEGSEVLQSIASRIQTLTPDALKSVMPNIRTPAEITAYDEARKYLTMAQQNQPGAERSDAGLATAGASSPSVHISNAAARLLVQAQLSVERSKQAMLLEFNDTHPQGTEGDYSRWKTAQAPKIDPRAFITDGQTPAERKSYYDRLGDTEQKNYLESYKLAKKWQLLTAPNG